MENYTIYIGLKPDGRLKIGCDENYPNRPIQQKMTEYRILEEHNNIYIASDREIELQNEYGVHVDSEPYYIMKSKGIKGGTTCKQNGSLRRNQSLGGIKNTHTIVKCPYCTKEGNVLIMGRWHFDNCKHK
jgi:hypothetical protein